MLYFLFFKITYSYIQCWPWKFYNKEMRHKAIVTKEKVVMSTTIWNKRQQKTNGFWKTANEKGRTLTLQLQKTWLHAVLLFYKLIKKVRSRYNIVQFGWQVCFFFTILFFHNTLKIWKKLQRVWGLKYFEKVIWNIFEIRKGSRIVCPRFLLVRT